MKRGIAFPIAIVLLVVCIAGSLDAACAQQVTDPRMQEVNRLFNEAHAAAEARDFAKAIPLYEQMVAIRGQVLGPKYQDLAVELTELATLYQDADYGTAKVLFERAVVINEKVHGPEHLAVAASLQKLAGLYMILRGYDQAKPLYERALAIREKQFGLDLATGVSALQEVYRLLGDDAGVKSLHARFERALAVREKTLGPEHPQVADGLSAFAGLHGQLRDYARAQPLYERALTIREKVYGPVHVNVAASLNNLANVYKNLGSSTHSRAQQLYERALTIHEKTYGPEDAKVAASLNNLANVYMELGPSTHVRAKLLYERALAIYEKLHGPRHSAVEMGLYQLAWAYRGMGEPARAAQLFERALSINENLYGPEHRNQEHLLMSLQTLYSDLGDYARAKPYYQRHLMIASIEGGHSPAYVQADYARFHAAQGHYSTAILYGKQAVNSYQRVRKEITELDPNLQRSFLRGIQPIYQALSDWLITTGRLPEAQQVLAMLKEEEFFEFLRRDGSADSRTTRAGYTGAETPWVTRFAEISGRVAEIGSRRQALEQRRQFGLLPTETSELKQLEADGEVARKAVVAFLDNLTAELGKLDARRQKDVARRDVEGLENYQDDLRKLPGAVMLHYVVLPDKVRIIFTSPEAQTGRVANVSEKELNAKIAAFRLALQNPAIDPRPLAQELYQWLIAPVAADLEQASAQVVMVSLDGTLRYLPIAALHDGKSYVVERYRITQITEAAKNNLTSRFDNDNRLTGLGVTRAVEGFSALPSVREELDGILKHGGVKGTTHFDEAFTAERVREALTQRVPLVHVASHFKFNPGTETDSFLLLGDGKRLSLRELREAGYNFRGVDLLTLSACETAVGGGADANGREVEGFGALAQQRGARAVMASLWPVADESTAVLMQNFYRLRAQGGDMNKAEALQQAQLLLLRGNHAKTQAGATAPYAHPFFWAPFILMGNWL